MRSLTIWMRRAVLTLIVLWGTFAAVVAFAVRYELGPFAPPDVPPPFPSGSSILETVTLPRADLGAWEQMQPPDEIVEAFWAALAAQLGDSAAATAFDPAQLSLSLEIGMRDSTAVWVGRYRVGCDCPYSPEREDSNLTILLDPYSGEVLVAAPAVGDTLLERTGEEVRP